VTRIMSGDFDDSELVYILCCTICFMLLYTGSKDLALVRSVRTAGATTFLCS
jgi:hypothetical protein